MTEKQAEIKDSRDDLPVFIHSELDDYGLSAIEFRVYARLARRCGHGAAFESVPNMAKDFEVSHRTVQRSLKVLVKTNLVTETIRPGKPTLYTLNPQASWHSPRRLKAIREGVINKKEKTPSGGDTTAGGDMRDGGGVTPRQGVGVTPQTDEGTPSEGSPPKVLTPAETPSGVNVETMLSLEGKPTGEWWRYGVRVLSVGEEAEKGLRGLLGRESGRHGPKRVLEALRETERAKPAEPKSYFLGILKKAKATDDVYVDFIARMRAKAEGVVYGTGDPKRKAGHAEGTDNAILSSPTASAA